VARNSARRSVKKQMPTACGSVVRPALIYGSKAAIRTSNFAPRRLPLADREPSYGELPVRGLAIEKDGERAAVQPLERLMLVGLGKVRHGHGLALRAVRSG
jgi:hypothetical protein